MLLRRAFVSPPPCATMLCGKRVSKCSSAASHYSSRRRRTARKEAFISTKMRTKGRCGSALPFCLRRANAASGAFLPLPRVPARVA